MNKLITTIEEYSHFTNDLTREMDTYLINSLYYNKIFRTYNRHPINNKWGIRYSGATRGHIEVDENNIIIDIVLYTDSYNTDKIYKPEVTECFKKYIGMELIVISE